MVADQIGFTEYLKILIFKRKSKIVISNLRLIVSFDSAVKILTIHMEGEAGWVNLSWKI
jgi:hypothetical protein